MTGSLTLARHPSDVVKPAAKNVAMLGNIEKAKLIEYFGADIRLPDLREEIAQCARARQVHDARGVQS